MRFDLQQKIENIKKKVIYIEKNFQKKSGQYLVCNILVKIVSIPHSTICLEL